MLSNEVSAADAHGRPSATPPLYRWLPWLVLAVSLAVTHQMWKVQQQQALTALQAEFDARVRDVLNLFSLRMRAYQQVLRGGAGLFAASKTVERHEFRNYVAAKRLAESYPGIQGVGFNLMVPKAEKDRHITALRREGFPEYSIRPEGERDIYTPVIYLEPFSGLNVRALGYDTYSEPVRRDAMERARDSGEDAVTGKLTLVQETGREAQAGVLMYLPVYKKGALPETPAERRASFIGWVSAVFRMDDLMAGILGARSAEIDIEIYDGETMSTETLMYDADKIHRLGGQAGSLLQSHRRIEVAGRAWTMLFSSLPGFEARLEKGKAQFILMAGTLASLLLTLLTHLLAHGRERAERTARKMTQALTESVIDSREQQMRLSAILGTVADAVITIDERGIVESFNLAAVRIFGYQTEEVVGKNVSLLMPEPYHSEHDGYLQRFLREGTPRIIGIGREVVGKRKDGSTFPMELSVGETAFSERRIFTGVVRDISERKRTEQELAFAKENANIVFNDEVMWVIDAMARGDLSQRISVDAQGEMSGHIKLSNTINAMVDRLNLLSEEVTRVAREVGSEGKLGGQAEVPGVAGTWKELTDNVNRMAANLTGQVRAIAEVTTAVAGGDLSQKIGVDAQGEIQELKTTINAMVDRLNLFSEEVTRVAREVGSEGKLGGQAEVPGVAGTWKELTDNVNRMAANLTGQVRAIAVVTTAVAGGDLSQKIEINMPGEVDLLKGDINTMIRTLATDRDARDRTEAALVLAREGAEAANRAKSYFLANMSHEIRTPMNAIIGLSHLCLQTNLNGKQYGYVSRVNQAARGLLGVINDILDFSKIDADMLVLEVVHFELQASLDAIDSNVGYLARAKDLRFETIVAADVPAFLVGDPLRLGQVLLNLASNAVKFTQAGGISVAVALKDAVAQSVELEFRVRDSGIGLAPGQIEGLFSAFTQVDTSTTRKFGGTGLGLAIAKRLVELMGGRIWVESEAGAGSSFCFTARFGRGEASQAVTMTQAAKVELAGACARLRDARILVAEDNSFNQQVIEELLQQCGVVVRLCGNGREALEQLAKEPFDIVLMDVQMPVMDGYEATRQIRATPALAGQRVIAMTANAMVEDGVRCLEAGMDDFETKPIDPDHLYLTLAKWLPEAAATPGAAEAVEAPPIDLAVLGQLLKNDPAKIASFARKFVQTARATLIEMEAAQARRDLAALGSLGHRQKSAAASVGAPGFAALCQALEDASKAGDWLRAEALLLQLPPLLARIALQVERETG